MSRKLGYARVSTTDQSLDLQLSALKQAGCVKIYRDHGVSGSVANSPRLLKAFINEAESRLFLSR